MSDDDTKTEPVVENKPARGRPAKAQAKVGDVIKVGDGYALVVGSEKVRHQHQDANGESTGAETRDHPLIVDLPAPRRYELDHTPAA